MLRLVFYGWLDWSLTTSLQHQRQKAWLGSTFSTWFKQMGLPRSNHQALWVSLGQIPLSQAVFCGWISMDFICLHDLSRNSGCLWAQQQGSQQCGITGSALTTTVSEHSGHCSSPGQKKTHFSEMITNKEQFSGITWNHLICQGITSHYCSILWHPFPREAAPGGPQWLWPKQKASSGSMCKGPRLPWATGHDGGTPPSQHGYRSKLRVPR